MGDQPSADERTLSGFKPGDLVFVTDPGLAMLRDVMRRYGEEPTPNHFGVVDEVDGDTVFINFDDGGCAPYPSAEVRLRAADTEPRRGGAEAR